MWMFLYSSEINLSLGWTWQFLAINSNTVFDIYDMRNEMSDCNSGRFESSSLEKWYSQVMLCQNHKRIVKLWVKWRSIGLEWWIKVLCFGRSHLPWSNSQKWPECFLVSPSVQCFQLHLSQLLLLDEVLVMEWQLFPVLDNCPCHTALEMAGDSICWLADITLGVEHGWITTWGGVAAGNTSYYSWMIKVTNNSKYLMWARQTLWVNTSHSCCFLPVEYLEFL